MRLVDRYLLREFLQPVIFCLASFCMLLVVYDLFDHLPRYIAGHTPLTAVFAYYGFLVIQSMEFLAPATLLLATLYTLWQLTRNNELTAIRASGIGLYRVMVPFIAVGVIFATATLVVKEAVVPRASLWVAAFVENKYALPIEPGVWRDRPLYDSALHRLWRVGEYRIESPHLLRGVKVTQERPDGTRAFDILAEHAEFREGQWWFHGVQRQLYDRSDHPVGRPTPTTPDPRHPEPVPYLSELPTDFMAEFKGWEYLNTLEMWRYLQRRHAISAKTLSQKYFDMHARTAMPWACVVVVLFGIPAGARSGRQGATHGIFMALGFFFAYYALAQIGILLGKGQPNSPWLNTVLLGRQQVVWPWLAAWLSNLVFLAAGAIMIRRMR